MNVDNGLLLNDEGCQILIDIIPLGPVDLFPTYNYIAALNKQIGKLEIDINTQSLRLEVERVKLQKLQMMFKYVKHERIPTNNIQKQLETMNNIYASKIARLSTVFHRCFSRLHQILFNYGSVYSYVHCQTY